ncbi:CLUMA_CG002193, isoform A [Clunio marinus]|uniref:CLUMA_CG002193, isoform A n=1 Tax=Clunio marinus TaxID=568069 RepID=A0A1J1HKF4_9DIPT|nr:CLUMA_CG002193, isoform A [Clunio marinus]
MKTRSQQLLNVAYCALKFEVSKRAFRRNKLNNVDLEQRSMSEKEKKRRWESTYRRYVYAFAHPNDFKM